MNGVEFNILYPPKDFFNKKKTDTWRTPNNNSLVVKVIFGSHSFLFPGDIMAKAEKELSVLAGNNLKSTVLLAPHHGSGSSSTPPFLAKVQPQYTIISIGWHNRFNFPHPSVIAGYKKINSEIFIRANGAFSGILFDGNELIGFKDPIGTKPLYYCNTNEYFALSSELKALAPLKEVIKIVNPGHIVSSSGNVGQFYKYPVFPSSR